MTTITKSHSQMLRDTGRFLMLLLFACLAQTVAADPTADEHLKDGQLKKEQLIGAWRLVGIEYSGPKGASVDPFYQADSGGIIVYDASGWMSVHIAAPHRVSWEVPGSRLSPPASAKDAELKAAAFDTYYAYFGTWEFDEATSVVTHHVVSALIPAETGLSYPQKVTLDKGRLVFTNRSGKKGEETVRRKIWERAELVTGAAK
jgi:hypothetical protein